RRAAKGAAVARQTMKLARLLKPFASFRAQMVTFIAGMLILTTVVIMLINQRLEERTTRQIGEYIRAITVAYGLVPYSLSEGLFLADLVNQPNPDSLRIDSESIIRHILIVESDGKIFDSTDRRDRGQQFKSVIEDTPVVQVGDLKRDLDVAANEQSYSLKF